MRFDYRRSHLDSTHGPFALLEYFYASHLAVFYLHVDLISFGLLDHDPSFCPDCMHAIFLRVALFRPIETLSCYTND